jgi:hypothetical protein
MLTTPFTEQARQQEWNTVHTMARNNGFPLQIIHNLKNKLTLKTRKTERTLTQTKKEVDHIYVTVHSYTKLPTCSKVPTST